LLASVLGGALLALTFPKPGFTLLAWFALLPLFLRANAVSRREAAKAGFAAGASFHAVAFFWIYPTCRYAGIPAPAAFFVLLLLASFQALPWAFVGWLGRSLTEEKARSLRPWVWAAAWTAVFAACERWTPRMPADLLVNTQWSSLSLLQCASWGGPHLLGFVIVLVNASLAEAWLDAREPRSGPSVLPLCCGAAAALLLAAHGGWTLLASKGREEGFLWVGVLSPSVDQYEKWDRAKSDRVWSELLETADARHPMRAALVVWPETSVPRWGSPESEPVPEAAAAARSSGAPQLVGLVSHSAEGPHNAAQLIAADGALAGVYRKRELVPFGEYVPFRRLIPRWAVDRWFGVLDRLEDVAAGEKDQPLLETAWGKASVTICYEALFPRWALRDARRGARVIVNMTNDGWYRGTWEPSQHFAVNTVRAVETRSWLFRAANDGFSGVFSPWGTLSGGVASRIGGRIDVGVPTSDPWPRGSWYARHGDILGSLCLLATAALSLARLLTRR
jgi:apolipoprotein N-acyltransferase